MIDKATFREKVACLERLYSVQKMNMCADADSWAKEIKQLLREVEALECPFATPADVSRQACIVLRVRARLRDQAEAVTH